MSRPLRVWTIYASPPDHPGRFVVRQWLVTVEETKPDLWRILCDTLGDARFFIPVGLVRLPRDPSDPPCVVETWL